MKEWAPLRLFECGEVITHDGKLYRVICPEHGEDCPGSDLRSGYIPPPLCIEDGHHYYVEVSRDELYAAFLLSWSRNGIPRGETQEEYAVRTGQPDMVAL